MRKRLVAAVLLAALAAAAAADSRLQHFELGNDLFKERKFDAAAEQYRMVLKNGFVNAAAEYNLGNALYRLGQIGRARQHYERAARLTPNDPDVRNNIRFIEQRYLKPTLREENFASIDRLAWRAVAGFPQPATLFMGLAAYLAFNLLIGWNLIRPGALHPAIFWSILIASLLVATAALAVAFTQVALAQNSSYGIVVAKDVRVASEPGADSPSSFPAPEAMKVLISQRQKGWLEIVLPNGSKGWVPADAIK